MLIETFLKTAAAPAIVVAILFFLFGQAPEPWRARVQSLILAAGFWTGCFLLTGRPVWPPQSGAASLVWVAIWMMLFPWAAPPGSVSRYLFRGIWLVVGTAIAVWSLRIALLNSPNQARNIIALGLLGWGLWSILERSVGRTHVLTMIVTGMVSFMAASFLFLFKSSLLLSQMLTTMAVIFGALSLVAWRFPNRISLHGVFPFLSAFLAVFLITGYVFLDIDPWLLIGMTIPFGILLLKTVFGLKPSSALSEAAACTVLSAVPLGYWLWHVFQVSGPLY